MYLPIYILDFEYRYIFDNIVKYTGEGKSMFIVVIQIHKIIINK